MPLIAPSLLASDFLDLGAAVDMASRYADLLHLDVMDGVFVPNISIGFPVVEAVSARSEKPLDVHLMIVNPEKYAMKFANIKGVGMVSFHLDACGKPMKLLEALRNNGVKAGLAINPDIAVRELYPYLDDCDFVLIMSVFAGFGGQSFIESSYGRIRELKEEIIRRSLDVKIEVDGGVDRTNAAELVRCGTDILVAGTTVFKSPDPASAIASLRG